jgi:hypothetical protein
VVLEKDCEGWAESVKNEGVLYWVKEERSILHTTKRITTNGIDDVLRWNCLMKHAIKWRMEGMNEGKAKVGRRRKHLLNGLKET